MIPFEHETVSRGANTHSLRPLRASFEQVPDNRLEDRQLMHMQRTFAPYGGMRGSTDIVRRLRDLCVQPVSVLAKWVVERKIVSFELQGQLLVPMFQFDADMSIRAAVSQVLAELDDIFDSWDVACWFAQPNGWLTERPPVALLYAEPSLVVSAARADRFLEGA